MEQREIIFVVGGATKKICSPQHMDFEAQFLRYLIGGFTLRHDRGYLVLENHQMRLWLKEMKTKGAY